MQERVIQAAEYALEEEHEVSPISVCSRLQLVAPVHLERWRRGQVEALDELMQGRAAKLASIFRILRQWAQARGLEPFRARYVRPSREGEKELRFTDRKFPGMEEDFHTHYRPANLPEKQRRTLEARARRAAERDVLWSLTDTACSECGAPIPAGGFLWMDNREPLCLPCVNLGELEFLPRGDTALTRRAGKLSARQAIVLRFNRSRKRYERLGILVTEEALRQAEQECATDAPERARARERAAAARPLEDARFVENFAADIRAMLPGCPAEEARRIALHAGMRGSGRVGRSAAGRKLEPSAVRLAIVAALRHNHTNYDELLAAGWERAAAREEVRPAIDALLEAWSRGV
jgi:hypothetical protein